MAFFCDLGIAISTWQSDGDHIILVADMNGNIWKKEISTFDTSLGLQESILSAHPTLLPPVTFSKETGWENLPLMEYGCLPTFTPLQYPSAPSP